MLAGFAVVDVVAVIAGAIGVAGLLSDLVTDPASRTFGAQSVHLAVIVAAFATRAAMTFLRNRYAHRAALATIAELRSAAVDALTDPRRTSPHELVTGRERASTVLLRGLDALVDYLADYVPALVSTIVITPLVIVVVGWTDWPSAVIIIVTIPLIPLFMALIGMLTRDRTRRKLDAMSRQSSQLLDLITGLPTLKALGRAHGPAARVDELGARLSRTTMSSLRIAFLSGAVLELLSTLCVALVAVGIGLRLVFGDMSLYAGVLALVLAPEAYLPLRRIGAAFHAAEDGMEASREVLALLDAPAAAPSGSTAVSAPFTVRVDDLGVRGRDGWTPRHLTCEFTPGRATVLSGPNGAGKSTVVAAVLGLERPDEGRVRINGVDVADLHPDRFHEQVAWLPQHPVLVPGTVADNLSLFGDLDPDLVARVSPEVAFDDVLADLPDGPRTLIGPGGTGLSAGQRQRLALVRTLASRASLVLLDEPTAHLDDETARRVLDAVHRRAADGATVILVSHRAETLDDPVLVTGEAVGR
ncbi:thiol reductant ABC exporter subunit CydD [Gordonia spumicola]|uniref:Thiol reductant ABC exporter subunit CydD n=1 Tax=Gordonia spumicola TaxID=589161 RepID=A0A7I9V7F4_9ACTN|nr:thiol reductant ABC exporter subunit CydD [Gordonia spumicola]